MLRSSRGYDGLQRRCGSVGTRGECAYGEAHVIVDIDGWYE